MKTMKLVGVAVAVLLASGCSGQKVASKDDTYLSAKEREKLNKSQQQAKASSGVDSREDNFSRSSREYDDDYCYSCRVRRYSTGVWYDPWWGPGWGPAWGWRSWYSPSWGWSWWSASWGPGWGWGSAWDPWWGWGPAYAGPGWYYTPGWGWSYYAGPGWWVAPSGTSSSSGSSYTPRYNYYRPRTYTTPSGSTTYTPPRGTVVTPGGTPPRRSTAPALTSPSRPSYTPTSPRSSGSARPSIQSGSTGAGGIRSSSPTGGTRPR
jgi:hypothetical protein